jgi:hypothetical protein
MNDTALIGFLLLTLNAFTCGIAYLIGHKAGLRDGFAHARRVRLMSKSNANA